MICGVFHFDFVLFSILWCGAKLFGRYVFYSVVLGHSFIDSFLLCLWCLLDVLINCIEVVLVFVALNCLFVYLMVFQASGDARCKGV